MLRQFVAGTDADRSYLVRIRAFFVQARWYAASCGIRPGADGHVATVSPLLVNANLTEFKCQNFPGNR